MSEINKPKTGDSLGGIVLFLLFFGVMLIGYSNIFRKSPDTVIWANIGTAVGFFIITSAFAMVIVQGAREVIQYSTLDRDLSMSGGLSDLEHAVSQLGKNYDILRRQANQGFLLACALMALGFLVILVGSLGQLLGIMQASNNLITIAGIVVEAVSALGLVLFRETSKRLNVTSDRLHEIWRILAAFKQADSLDGEKKTEMRMTLISRLAGLPRSEISDGEPS